jgi:hypothetical protein
MRSTIDVMESKMYYYIDDRYSSFMCKVTKKTLPKLQKLLADCIRGKIPPSIYDDRHYDLNKWFYPYGCKGNVWSITKDRVADVLISLSLYKHEIKDKQDLAKLLGFKTYCKSVDKILKSLPLQSVAVLYNILRKEIIYGKTSSSYKTRKFDFNS